MATDTRPAIGLDAALESSAHKEAADAASRESPEPPAITAWEVARERLADRWPILTIEEIDSTQGRMDLLTALLQAKLSYAHRLAQESIGQPLILHRPPRQTATRGWLNTAGLLALSCASLFGLVLYF